MRTPVVATAMFLLLACSSTPDPAGPADGGTPTDTTPPLPGDGLVLTTSNLTTTGVTLSWGAATDNVTAAIALQYRVYWSTSNRMNSVADVEANGTATGAFAPAITQAQVSGLTPATAYFFNVIVKDEAGNKAAYAATSATTPAKPIYLFAIDPIAVPFTKVGVETACATKHTTTYASLACSKVAPMLPFSDATQIINLPTAVLLPTDRPVFGPTGVKIGNSFPDLLDGSILASMQTAGVSTVPYWTAASLFQADGTWTGTSSCAVWTDPGGGNANTGDPTSTTSAWLRGNAGSCPTPQAVLCFCWEP